MAFSARAVGRATLVLVAFYGAFFLLHYGALVVEWAVLEGLRVTGGFELVHEWVSAGRGLVSVAVPNLLAAVVLYAILVRRLGWSWPALGWPAAWPGRLAAGTAWGIGLAAVTLGACVAGGARIARTPAAESLESYVAVALPVGAALLVAALVEELLFRGYPLQRLARTTGRVPAAVGLAAVFAALHGWNPEVAALGLVNIGLASVLLSAVFFSPAGLAGAWGLHWGWNAGLVLLADAPVSGLALTVPRVAYAAGPNEWWTGGPFGPEGGVAASVVLLAAALWWGRTLWRQEETTA